MSKKFKKDGKEVNKTYYQASPELFKTFKTENFFIVDEVGQTVEIETATGKVTLLELKCTPVDEGQNKVCESKNIFPLFNTIDLSVVEGNTLLLQKAERVGGRQMFILIKGAN